MGLLADSVPAVGGASASELSKLAGRPFLCLPATLSTFVAPRSLSVTSQGDSGPVVLISGGRSAGRGWD